MEDIKFSKSFVVTMHNDLVHAKFSDSLTINEQKILFAVLSNVEPPKREFIDGKQVIVKPVLEIPTFRVPVKQFTEFLGIKDPNYTQYNATVKKLMKKLIEIRQPNGSWELFQWVTSAKYISDTGIAEIKVSPELYPYLLNLERDFTTAKLHILLNFKSMYSSKLYQLLTKWSKLGSWKVELDELRSLMGVSVKKESNGVKEFRLPKYSHFKERALQVAVNEINEYTNLEISITEHKTGKKVTAITFNITTKKAKATVDKKQRTQSNSESHSTVYGKEFLGTYTYVNQEGYVEKATGNAVLFDGKERIKAILCRNTFESISDESLIEMEKVLENIIDIHEFNICKEIHYLFQYTKTAKTITKPGAFIVSILKKVVREVEEGNYAIKVSELLGGKAPRYEAMPAFMFQGLQSKKMSLELVENEKKVDSLPGTNLTVTDVKRFELMEEFNQIDSISGQLELKYEEYKSLKETGRLDHLIEAKTVEL